MRHVAALSVPVLRSVPLLFAGLLLLAAPASAVPPKPAKSVAARAPTNEDPARPTGNQTATEGVQDLAAASTATAAEGPVRQTALAATMYVKVVHPDDVRRDGIAKAKELGGFPILVSDAELQLKVPPERLAELVDWFSAAGTCLQKSWQRNDRTEHIAQLEARIRSKREILARLRTFIDDSNAQATLRIERSMTQLVAEVEALKGELDVEQASVRHARLVVQFQFHREGRIKYVQSPFEWLNRVDLGRFLSEFQ